MKRLCTYLPPRLLGPLPSTHEEDLDQGRRLDEVSLSGTGLEEKATA